ncbi:hypothetical protein XA68_16069 [Ophiocordyceps unilateralis]|uniref:Uncharacterized protein n=1 Tax=Ophiocordyceps unilateralis TaxID=268505 RepID=A0A2A9PKE8_OPHUN|nr:hypothetical protein XA68_16069 [Ophiocordyceps unilateralis]
MSSTAPRSGERMVHQDYIARVRYSNALPPPPTLPKLLDIPNTGLASGQYTTPGFASRLAREQPLNIEADAELGMPLNLIGMPGVFDGDERSIQAPPQAPSVHPHDRPLLRPLAALGKPKVAEANVSFLRRTEYISSSTTKRPEPSTNPMRGPLRARKPVRPAAPDADSPQAIKRKIDGSFEQAELELKDPKRVRHPSKKQAQVVDVLPLLPDLDGFPDSGAYVTIKFLTNPVSSSSEYDRRLLSSFLRPIERTATEEAMYEAALEAHERDPVNNAKPPNLMNYDFYLPHSAEVATNFRRKFDVDDADNECDSLYTHPSSSDPRYFQFDRIRAYETAHETELDQSTKYDDEIILARNDEDAFPLQRAFYYYPVMQRSAIRPQRTKNIARTTGFSQEGDESIIDQLDITVDEPKEEMRAAMRNYKLKPLGWDQGPDEPASADANADADADADVDAEAEADVDAEEAQTADKSRRASEAEASDKTLDEDRDAEGELEEIEDEEEQ